MRINSQNLTDGKFPTWMGGRAWLRNAQYNDKARIEWYFFSRVKWAFDLSISFGNGDSDRGVMLHIALPWLLSVYFTFETKFRCKECRSGISIHSNALWISPLCYVMESRSDDPWYRKSFCFNFPWQLDWHSTEILTEHTPELAKRVWIEHKGDRKRLGIDSIKMFEMEHEAAAKVTTVYDYTYVRKNGEVQIRTAAIYVERRTWRARWYPIIPYTFTRTSINVSFNEEIGEGVGSWKGGTVGCGYDMKPDETPWECLRRMERERKFSR